MISFFNYRTITFFGPTFQWVLLKLTSPYRSPTTPKPEGLGLGYSAFARRYQRNLLFDFFSCRYLDVSVPCVRDLYLCIQYRTIRHDPYWVSPFGHPGVKGCQHLVRAFRSQPRPSSLPGAKASSLHPFSPHQKKNQSIKLPPKEQPKFLKASI